MPAEHHACGTPCLRNNFSNSVRTRVARIEVAVITAKLLRVNSSVMVKNFKR
jgi:hypothetical protein